METAYIGLGGNVGDVIAAMAGALQKLDENLQIEVRSVSAVYRTPPWGVEDQDWFHNACAKLVTSLQPFELLEECLKIERIFKRERRIRWGPRTLDIDILVFGDHRVEAEHLTIPHPRISERSFVLKPLADIAPDLEFEGKTSGELLQRIEDSDPEQVDLDRHWWKSEIPRGSGG